MWLWEHPGRNEELCCLLLLQLPPSPPEFRFGAWQHGPSLTGSPSFGAALQPPLPNLTVLIVRARPQSAVLGASPVGARASLGRGSSVGARERAPSQCASAIVLTRRHMAPSETAK